MDTRREFLRKTMLLSGAAGMATLPPAIQKALAINPEPGSTWQDAEHIVLLMQENRSFDHAFGTLRGVRGFNDPRAITLPGENKVWIQKNSVGETYAPFRLDIKDSRITWMGSLPHSRESQTGARNEGRMDNWIDAKKSGEAAYAKMPLTMGHYTREDIPFYYALADAFTVCDQHFCASLTPTDPNRLYFWTGTVRAEKTETSRAMIDNDTIEQGITWSTFPELLEQNGIAWKIYQNELNIEGGFTGEEDSWLANFGDNTLEFFDQYQIKLSPRYRDYLPKKISGLEKDIASLRERLSGTPAGSSEQKEMESQLVAKEASLLTTRQEQEKWTAEKYAALPAYLKAIHEKAFTVNSGDPFQHELTPLQYLDGDTQRQLNIPKGDILHQFRSDVENGQLPTVSWLVAPENFSDHPSAPWFGSWYLSEVMDILTSNPEVWKKTIFILTYDENDGYFDHVPPFTPPDFHNASSGKVSTGIDTRPDWVTEQRDLPGPIGLGFRVPMIIASPWSRGGWVNSQVFDHTSNIRFLENFLNHKFNKNLRENNITDWRRTISGDLSSVFRQYNNEKISGLPFIPKDPFIESIHKAKFKNVPADYKNLSAEEIRQINTHPANSPYFPQQEKGLRPACPLPYELFADGNLDSGRQNFTLSLGALQKIFGESAAGSPFIVYTRNYQGKDFREQNYAVKAGDQLDDNWQVADFTNNSYHLQVLGPNGFFREFKGSSVDPQVFVSLRHLPEGNAEITVHSRSQKDLLLEVSDNSYHQGSLTRKLEAGSSLVLIPYDLSPSFGWYDFSLKIIGAEHFGKRYAGRVETGKATYSDPAMA